MSEEALLRAIKKIAGRPGPGVVLGIGDDAGVLRVPRGEDAVLSQDALVEGRDFLRSWGSAEAVGWKAAAAALSDLAGMGARPLASFLTLVLPPAWKSQAQGLVRGFAACARKYGAPLAGGDLSGGNGALVLDGVVLGSVRRGHELRREGAKAGDLLAVTGRLGGAKAALERLQERKKRKVQGSLKSLGGEEIRHRFFHPEPRLGLGCALSRGRLAAAAMDISDGLALDLFRLCRASGVGAELEAAQIPLHPWIFGSPRGGDFDPVEYALGSGEEYELLLAFRPGKGKALRGACARAGVPLTVVGRVTGRGDGLILNKGGRRRPMPVLGFQHRI